MRYFQRPQFGRIFILIIALSIGLGQATALEVVNVQVSSVSGTHVYLNKGRSAGLQTGDTVVFQGPGQIIRGVVRSVSKTSARCTLRTPQVIAVGTQGQLRIPRSRRGPPPAKPKVVKSSKQTLTGLWIRSDNVRFQCVDHGDSVTLVRLLTDDERVIIRDYVVTLKRAGGGLKGQAVFHYVDRARFSLEWSFAHSSEHKLTGQSEALSWRDGRELRTMIPYSFTVYKNHANLKRKQHSGWTRPPENWDQNQPLLGSALSLKASERDGRIFGRTFAQFVYSRSQSQLTNQYAFGRLGTEITIENPFKAGGGLFFDGEFSTRANRLEDEDTETEHRPRLDRLSYYWGGDSANPLRVEVGRLLHHELQELGLIDGFELGYRTQIGHRFGLSFGYLPERTSEMRTGKDLQASLFYRFVSNDAEDFVLGLGYQKTWHEGQADRDLLIGNVQIRPVESLTFNSTTWIDHYRSDDEFKDRSFEVTQFNISGNYQFIKGHGVGLFVTEIRNPQLQRFDYSTLTLQQSLKSRVTRSGVYSWHEFSRHLRLDARADWWKDTFNTGNSFEFRVTVRDWLYDRGEISVAVYTTNGRFSKGPGFRFTARKNFSIGSASLSYDSLQIQ
jgi:hypothetical protein